MNKMLLHCQVPEIKGELVRRSCVIERTSEGVTTRTQTLWIEMPRLPVMPEEDDTEPFLLMAFLPAMVEGRDIQVDGAVSREMLFSLAEFRDLWSCWDAQQFKRIDFSSDRLLDAKQSAPNRQAVSAFSGGLDSSFTAWRHKTGTDPLVMDLRYCMIVHGFDIPLKKEAMFQRVFETGKAALQTLNLELIPVRTNCRTIFSLNWLIWHGPAVAACLNLFKGVCGAGLLGGTFGCRDQIFPYGSNPISDPLLSSAGFKVIHDGIAYSRLNKFKALVDWPAGYDTLRICFAGIDKNLIEEGNCGKCSKCVRSLLRINFRGLPIPKSFPGFPSSSDILKIRPSAFEAHLWRIVVREAISSRQPISLVLAVTWMFLICTLARLVKKTLQAAGLWEPSFP